MEILQDVVKVARKPHRCCLCGCDIKPGQMYASQRCVEDGEFWETKSHCECRTLASYLDMFDGCDDSLTEESFKWCIEEYAEDKFGNNSPRLHGSVYEQVKLICEQLNLQSR
jgi:hypothetical protein